MALFRYNAFDDSGALIQGEIEAPSNEEAQNLLWERGLTPFETSQAKNAFKSALFGRRSKIGLAELTSFTRELATLEQANLPLDDGLRILVEQSTHRALSEIVQDLLANVLDGRPFSQALRAYPHVFGEEFVNVVQAGETSGALGRALAELADLLERRLELQGKMRSALVYPTILIAMAFISVGVVVAVLAPNVAPIFADSGRPLPGGLRFIMSALDHWIEILSVFGAVIGAGFLLRRMILNNPVLRQAFARRLLNAPFVGSLAAKQETARFSRTLGSLIRAGVPLLTALNCARDVIRNQAMAADLYSVIEDVRNGKPLADALAKIEAIPPLALRMVRVGEETGQVGAMLTRLAAMFDVQNQRVVDRLMSALTPVLTILIAGIVGGLIMSVMTAILSINELAAQ